MNDERHRTRPGTLRLARVFRKRAPKAERLVWSRLRNRQLGGLRFYRQRPIGRYIADFCCPARAVIVELDGDSHCGREREDAVRQRYLEAAGYTVIRYGNDYAIRHLDALMHDLALKLGLEIDEG